MKSQSLIQLQEVKFITSATAESNDLVASTATGTKADRYGGQSLSHWKSHKRLSY